MKNIDIQIKETDLKVQEVLDFVTSEESGGIDILWAMWEIIPKEKP